MVIRTYLLHPDKGVANERDRLTSEIIGRFLTKVGVDFYVLPWGIPPVFSSEDEQHYFLYSDDSRLRKPLQEGNFIVLNTSGYAHSRTYFFERALKIPSRIHLQLDSHADLWNSCPHIIGSDGFNAELLNLQGVDYCSLIGVVPNQNLIPRFQSEEQIKRVLSRLDVILMEDIEKLKLYEEPWIADCYESVVRVFPGIKGNEFRGVPKDVDLSNVPAYVSVDLDVLQDFPSSWKGHGRFDTELLSRLITKIGERYRIIAGDICGLDSKYLPHKEAFDAFMVAYQSLKFAMNLGNRGISRIIKD